MTKIHQTIENYYTDKIKEHGPTPKGVDWNGEESQTLRFQQLSKIIELPKFTLADIGCGYGSLSGYLDFHFQNYKYFGYDISKEMIKEAQIKYAHDTKTIFKHLVSLKDIEKVDYILLSGIFNIKLHYNNDEWLRYILDTLDSVNTKAKHGFTFNILTKYSDKEYMKESLYYADPLYIFDYCKKNFSKNIALYHDYDLYEFTISVKKDI